MRVSRGFWMRCGTFLAVLLALTTGALAYDLSGTVSNGTAKSGRIYLNVQSSYGGGTGLGVSIPAAGPYTIRGVPNGSYTVQAFMDTQLPEAGIHHASDPAGQSPPVTVNNGNASGADLTLGDPPTPNLQSPPSAQGMGGNGMAFVMWDAPYAGNRAELTRSYTVYWGSSPNPGPGNFQGKSPELPSARQSGYLVSGLSNGSSLYFSVTARLASGTVESAPTNVNGGEPITIGAASGGYKISGTVDSTGIAKSSSTPLWVAAVVPNKAPVAFAYIANPGELQSFSISGLPSGSYQLYAILDMNNNGMIDAGDFMTPDDQASVVNVGSADVTGANFSLTKEPAGVSVSSNHWMQSNGSGYSLNFQAKGVNKLPVNVAVTGPQLNGYLDMAANQDGGGSFSSWSGVANRPQLSPADSYSFTLAYADGSSTGATPLTAQLMGVIDATATPLTPTGTISSDTPTFTWGAPSNPPPSPYFYSISVDGNNSHWESGELPGSQLSATYGFDGGAPALLPGMPYNWRVNLSDSHGDSAGSSSASFTLSSVPGAAVGSYSYDAGRGVLTLNWGSSSFVCQGPQPGSETKTVTLLNATTLSWLEGNGTRSWSRSSSAPTLTGTGADLVGTWSMTDGATGNTYSATFSQDGSVTASGTIRQCGGGVSMSGFSPMSGMPGTQVSINGSGFGSISGGSAVSFNGQPWTILNWSDNQIVAQVSSNSTGSGSISVTTASGATVTSSAPFSVTSPGSGIVISGFSPTSGGAGTQVTITGSGFGSAATGNAVYFSGTPAPILSWSDSQIVTSVPNGAMSGSISVSAGGMISWSSTPFTVPVLAPKVNWTLPGSDATGMPVKGGIFVGFDSQMDLSSLNSQSFTLQESTGASVPGSVQAGQDAIVFIPSSPLGLGRSYTATLSTGVRGMNGAALASSYSWNFVTESASSNSFTLDGGINSLDSSHDNGVNSYLYDVIRFGSDNAHLSDSWYVFQPGTGWVARSAPQQMNQYYGLTSSGWQLANDGPSAGVVTFNTDGSFTWSNSTDGSAQLMEPVEYKLSGAPLSSYANPKDLPAPPQGNYPTGSLAYLFRTTTVNDSYRLQIWMKEPGTQDQNYLRYNDGNNQQQSVTALSDLPVIFATGQKNNFLPGPNGNIGMQLGQDGTVQLLQFAAQGMTPITATGSWQYQTVKGVQLLMVHLPQGYQGGDGDLFYAALNGVVKQGSLRAAGSLKIDSHPNYNQTAFGWMIGATPATPPLASQSIVFGAAPALTLGGSGTVSAKGGASGNPVSFSSATPAICTIDGSTVTAIGVGNCVIAANQTGSASYAPAAQVTQSITVAAAAPGAPTVASVKAGNTQATIGFSAPASNGGSAITRYTVTSNPGNITVSGAMSPITVIGLSNGTSYSFTVTATNAAGSGPASAPSSAVTPRGELPGAPMSVTASAGNAGATVRFSAPVSNGGSAITGYTVTSTPEGGVDGNAGTTATTHLISGLSNGVSYSFTVTATNATGTGAASSPSNSVTPATLPGAPTGVAASADHGQAQVTFSAPASDGGSAIIGYTVTSTPGNISASGKGSPITVVGLSDGTSYTFTVSATSKAGSGAPSDPSNAVTPADSSAPVVRSFSVPGSVGADSSSGNALPISSFIATDNAAVTGYLVSTSSVKPAADAAGWSATPPASCQIGGSAGVSTVYAWAKDAAGNVSAPYSATVVVTPTDTTAPVILAGPMVTSLSNNSAVVEWQTDEAALGGVKYGDSPAPVGGSNESVYQTRHSMTLSGLTPDTTYYLSVFAVDHAGNGPTLSKQITLRTKPAPDNTAPFIVQGPTVIAIGADTATVQWRTDEPARGQVSYGSSDSVGDSAAETGFSSMHSVRLTGLSAQTQYYFKVSATDAVGNGPRESAMGSFSTVALPDTTAPVVVEGPMVVNISNSGATVLWKTDEPATSTVISFDGANYGFFSDSTLSTSHSVTLTGLQGSKGYSYKVSSTDGSGNSMTLGSFKSFSTLAAPDTTAPVLIQGPLVVAVDHQSAAIRWDTDEPSDSVVEYGTSDSFGSSSSQGDLQRSHNLTLTGLQPGTVYYFRVLSTDAFGNGPTASRGFSFTTAQNPSYKVPVITVAPTIIYKTDTSMTVYWETDDPSDSVVQYGAGEQLTQRVSNSDKVNRHQITITNLQKNSSYKVVVSSTNMSGNTVYAKRGGAARHLAYNLDSVYSDASGAVSSLGSVTTEAEPDTTAPVITVAPAVAAVTDHQATITWSTDKISDSQILYGPQGGALTLSAGDPTQVTSHVVVLTNLAAGSQYQFQVSSTDPSGNGPTTSSVASFTTAATPDITPPAFQGNPALVVSYQDGTGKTTVGWSTDKLATTQINYGTSSTALTSQAALPGLATSHSLTLALQPGTTYYAAAVAIDSSGNVASSTPLQFSTMGSADLTAPSTSTNPAAGSYLGAQSVTLSCDKPATIYYTTDGSTPTTSSAQYNGPIAVTSSKSIRFFAIDAAGNQEAPHAAAFVIQHQVSSSSDLNGAISCPAAVNGGETALCTVTANTGYKIGSVSGCGGTLNGTTFTTGAIGADCGVAASFTPITFGVTPVVAGSGSIDPATVQTVSYGSSSSFTLTPADGYQLASVTGCGGTLSGNSYSTGLLSAGCTVTATFTPTDPSFGPLGDLTGDGKVDVADALRALQIGVGLITATDWDLSHGDVGPLSDGKPKADGKIDVSDAMLILKKSVGLTNW